MIKLLNIVNEEGFFEVKTIKTKTVIKSTTIATEISAVQRKKIKQKQLLQYAAKNIPSISGILIISTSAGIMTHIEAANKRIGGQVIARVC